MFTETQDPPLEITKKWIWKTKWCKKYGLSPYTESNWNKAEKNYMAFKKETKKEKLIRRLGEYIEYANKTQRFTDVGFYTELIEYIKNSNNIKEDDRTK